MHDKPSIFSKETVKDANSIPESVCTATALVFLVFLGLFTAQVIFNIETGLRSTSDEKLTFFLILFSVILFFLTKKGLSYLRKS